MWSDKCAEKQTVLFYVLALFYFPNTTSGAKGPYKRTIKWYFMLVNASIFVSKTVMSEIILGNSFVAAIVNPRMDFSHLITRVIVQLLTEFPDIRLQFYEREMEIILFNTTELSLKYYFLCILQQTLSKF